MERLKNLFISHQSQFLFLLILFTLLNFLSGLPFFNLIFNKAVIFVLLGLASIFLFKLSSRFFIKSGLILLCFCPFLVIIKRENLVEGIGNLIYGLLLIGIIQKFITYLREEKSEKKT